MTPIADMIERMFSENAPVASIIAAVRALEPVLYLSASSPQLSAVSPQTEADKSAERRRLADRDRKRRDRALRGPDDAWNALVQVIIERDGRRCFYCGSGEKLCADHKVPLSRGGTNDPSNLCACCRDCNLRKRNRTADEFRSNSEKQTMLAAADNTSVLSALSADTDTEGPTYFLSSLLTSESKERKKEVVARARATRMPAGAPLTAEFIEIAIGLGADRGAIPKIWDEFVDYWCALPGTRGTKIDWPATWRNRLRQIVSRGNPNGKASHATDSLGGFSGLAAKLRRKIAEQEADDDAGGQEPVYRR